MDTATRLNEVLLNRPTYMSLPICWGATWNSRDARMKDDIHVFDSRSASSLSRLTTVFSVNPLNCIHSAFVSIQHSDNSPLLK